jgi:UDP-N-acetylglucosamine--dolichyl-phosphate N-acetylglucosaminephosphotransferase
MELNDTQTNLLINAGLSAAGFLICLNIIPKFRDMFIKANLFGVDMSKRTKVRV